MTQQVINIGSAPNDGTGDQLRTAFDKSNDNFSELYAAVPTLQPLDADLTAIAALTGVNVIYYRSGTDAWSAITIGTGLSFSGGTLSCTISTAGYVLKTGDTMTGALSVTPASGNGLTVTGGAAGLTPEIAAGGADTNIGINFRSKGAGAFNFFSHGTTKQAAIENVAGASTYVRLRGAVGQGIIDAVGGGYLNIIDANLSAGASGGPIALTPTAGDSSTKVATTAFVQAAIAASSAVGTPSAPQGRLTLFGGTPVLTVSVAGATTLVYTPYVGNKLPIYDGTSMVMTTFAELSVATTDTTKSPAAIGASKVNDWFIWNDAGTIRLGHGPDWTNDTTRSAGTALVRINGILLNNAAITNGPAAQRGTYVGTTRSNASSLLDWIIGGVSAGGTAAVLGLWNAYNRIMASSLIADNTDSWAYAGAFRPANNSAAMRCSFVRGLDEDVASAEFSSTYACPGGNASVGIGLDITTAYTGLPGAILSGTGTYLTAVGTYAGTPGIGFHFAQAVEFASASCTFLGDGATTYIQSGLRFRMPM